MWSEARSIAYSAYTVKSVTYFKEQTSDLSGHATRHEKEVVACPHGESGNVFPITAPSHFERFYTAAARRRIGVFYTPMKTG